MKKKISTIVALMLAVSVVAMGCSSEPSTQTGSADASVEETQKNETKTDDEAKTSESVSEYPALKQADGQLVVGYIHGRNDSEAIQRSARQVTIEAAHRGWKLVDVTWNTDQETKDGIQNLINQNVDAILIGNCSSMDAKVDVVQAARQKGIGVYNLDNQNVEGVIANSTMPGGVAAMELLYAIGVDTNWNANVGTIAAKAIGGHIERTFPIEGFLNGVYPNFKLLASEDMGDSQNPSQTANDFAAAWLQKYGDDLDVVIGSADIIGMGAAEAVIKNGDSEGEKTICAGMDGGSQAWSYIRDNTPFQYSYAQPVELYAHNIMELIDQLQVQGMKAGDDGCLITHEGSVIYANGMVVTRENVPDAGQSIHAVFNYYGEDPKDQDAWYNWTDGDGPYTITE